MKRQGRGGGVPPGDGCDYEGEGEEQEGNKPPTLTATPSGGKSVAPIDENDVLHEDEGA